MVEYRYLLSGVGYVSRETVKKIINNPYSKFSGFERYKDGIPGAYGIVIIAGKTHRIDIQYFEKVSYVLEEEEQEAVLV